MTNVLASENGQSTLARRRTSARFLRWSSSSRRSAVAEFLSISGKWKSDLNVIRNLKLETRFSYDDLKHLEQQFLLIANREKLMPPEAFRESMGILGAIPDSILCERLFSAFNTSRRGMIDFTEFVKGLNVLIKGTVDEKLTFAFAMTDIDGSGQITLKELEITIESIMRIYSGIMGSSNATKVDREEIKKVFSQLDRNRDGFITLEEYKTGMKRHPEFVTNIRGQRVFGLDSSNRTKEYDDRFWRYRQVATSALRDVDESVEILNTLLFKHGKTSDCEVNRQNSDHVRSFNNDSGQAYESGEAVRPKSMNVSDTTASKGKPELESKALVTPSNEKAEDIIGGSSRISMSKLISGLAFPPYLSPFSETAQPPLETEKSRNLERDLLCRLESIKENLTAVLRSHNESESIDEYGEQCDSGERMTHDETTVSTVDEIGQHSIHFRKSSSNVTLDDQDFVMDSVLSSPNDFPDDNSTLHGIEGPQNSSLHSLGESVTESSSSNFSGRKKRGTKTDDGALSRYLTSSKKGSTVFFGHRNWDLVINVMKGIQLAVGRSSWEVSRELSEFDFSMKEKYSLAGGATSDRKGRILKSAKQARFAQNGNQYGTPSRFVDYCPMVFAKLREHFGIRSEDYVNSIGPGNMLSNLLLGSLSSLSELGSEGKSGGFFYFTSDGSFMVKTVHREEHKFLRRIIKNYYYHVTSTPNSMLSRIVGCHILRPNKGSGRNIGKRKMYFVVMQNVLSTDLNLQRRFDLKGSWVGRSTKADIRNSSPKTTLKDNDFKQLGYKVRIGPIRKKHLMEVLKRDVNFLQSEHIIDYSLLLGIHEHSMQEGLDSEMGTSDKGLIEISSLPLPESSSLSERQEKLAHSDFHPFSKSPLREMRSGDGKETYVMGIIDFLTLYSSRKVFERLGKIIFYDKEGVSVHRPSRYGKRFLEFVETQVIE